MDPGFKDRVVLVTGASGGIGQQLVRSFAAEGARVVVHYYRQQQAAESLARQLTDADVAVMGADLTSEAEVVALFQQAEQQLGPVEILVANAGVWPSDHVPIHQMTLQQWNHTLTTDLTSVFLCVREFFRQIDRCRLADPAAVLIGSTAGLVGEAGHSDYATAKGGMVHGLLLSLKNEMARIAPRGRVNSVCPGWTITSMTEKFSNQSDAVSRALQTIPMRKFGQPSDVADAVMFLASSRLAGHITGQTLVTGGGMEGRVLYDPDEINLGDALPPSTDSG